ncbi:hypothetical protein [Streptomyces sp. NRRL F-4474]|uniref:hypothetical protein n=1 Tax=Streptomyces sp. NRRL F-4474 TaxID=1463851 RepID=UPI00131D8EBF|nr:hypothetical protein [Streptomyces sp. NRRL F-4474]
MGAGRGLRPARLGRLAAGGACAPARPALRVLRAQAAQGQAWSDYVALGDPAYDAYDNQPCQVAFREWAAGYETGADAAELRAVLLGDCTREDFFRRGARWTVGLCSLLTLDGWWRKDGEPPLHGACDAPGSCPHTRPVADEGGGAGRLAALPADTLLVHVRCQVWRSGFGPPRRRWLASP